MKHAIVRKRLQRLMDQLEAVRSGMLELHDTIPAEPDETSLSDLAEPPALATRLRSDLCCVVADSIEPALRALRQMASDLPGGP